MMVTAVDKPLHVQVAEALGWMDCRETQTLCQVKIDGEWATPVRSFGWEGRPPTKGPAFTGRSIPHYDTDWAATGPLIEKYEINIDLREAGWCATSFDKKFVLDHKADPQFGPTPFIAVCNLILKLAEEGKLG